MIAAGEVVWCGLDSLGEHDGRIGLFLADKLRTLLPPRAEPPAENPLSPRETALLATRPQWRGFLRQLHEAVGGGYPGETLDALWTLVWRGLVTNDTFHALRAYVARPAASSRQPKRQHRLPPSVLAVRLHQRPGALEPGPLLARLRDRMEPRLRPAVAQSLWCAHPGVAATENMTGGFSAIYDVLKALEESGRIGGVILWRVSVRRSLLFPRRSICCEVCAMARRWRSRR